MKRKWFVFIYLPANGYKIRLTCCENENMPHENSRCIKMSNRNW